MGKKTWRAVNVTSIIYLTWKWNWLVTSLKIFLRLAKLCFLFLKVPYTSIKAEVTGKRVNRGDGWGDSYGLEVPVIYYFTSQGKLVNWIKEKLVNWIKGKLNLKQNLEKKMLEVNSLKSLITCIEMSETKFSFGVR